MSSDFSTYVRSLGPGGEPPDARSFDQLLATLRRALIHEMRKRSLWTAPPSFLGVYGGTSWSEGDLLEELLLDCYAFVFVRRLSGLKKQLLVRPNVDGLVFLSLRNFLYETQKRHDPLGYRVFEAVCSAVLRLVDAGTLHVLAGDSKIRNETVLGFTPWSEPPWSEPEGAESVDLRRHVERWNDELLPKLVAAWNRDGVVERLAERLTRLPEAGVEVFRFRDLVEPMKDDARARWHAIGRGGEGETAREGPAIVRIVRPDRGFEERESFVKLLECVERGLDRLGGSRKPRARQKEEYLRRLWLFLRHWAAETASLPSDKKLGELLDVPRGRIPELRERLGGLIGACREALAGPGTPRRREGETTAMSTESRRDQLRVRTGEAAARFAADRERLSHRESGPPRPGETYVFAATRAFAVEWAVLEPDPQDPRRLLVAPVDDHPLAGSLDLVTEDGRCLRCGREAWLDAAAFDPELRTGTLEEDVLERARRKRAAIAAGTLEASWSEREADADPEYRSWSDTLDEARAVLQGIPGNVVRFAQRQPTSAVRVWPGYALAAAFAAAAMGLSLWLGELRRQVDELSQPVVVGSSATREIRFLDGSRSETLAVSATDSHVTIYLLLEEVAAFPVYRLQLLEADGTERWTAEVVRDPRDELILTLPRRFLEPGVYRLRLSGRDGDRHELLDERELRVEVR